MLSDEVFDASTACGQLRATRPGDLLVETSELAAHLDRGPNRPQGVVLVGVRHTEHGHHRVADELLDDAAVPLDRSTHRVVPAQEERAQRLGVEALAEPGRVGEVAEEDRHSFPRRGGSGAHPHSFHP